MSDKGETSATLSGSLDWASRGFPVFPCRNAPDTDEHKSPLTRRGFKDATTDPKKIEAWWTRHPDALIGMPTGAASGIAVLDLDAKKGRDGLAAIPNWQSLSNAIVRTQSDGVHLYFLYDGKIRNAAGKNGVDVRGEGGYVIVPPSPGYTWVNGRDLSDLPPWPEDLRQPEAPEDSAGESEAGAAPAEIAAALEAIPNDDLDWETWNRVGMATYRATGGDEKGFAAFDRWSQKSKKYDAKQTQERWRGYRRSPPDRIGAGTIFHMAHEADPEWQRRHNDQGVPIPEAQGDLFDPWENYALPTFPFDILPDGVRGFVDAESKVIGCDPSALAMAALANFSGALDHRIQLKMMRNGTWAESPRLWVLLVGDPSRKKTPAINAALRELEACAGAKVRKHRQEIENWKADGKKPEEEPDPPVRYILNDVTVEMLGEILSRSDRGTLVECDELAGWIGGMEKYSAKGSAADRALWLKTFDGGPYTVDRIKRGELYIGNASCSIIGGIQPERLKELKALTTDGLLQRFIPIMMGPSQLLIDEPCTSAFSEYAKLTRELLELEPEEAVLSEEARILMEKLRKHLHGLEQVADGLARGLQGFVGKLHGIAGRISLILHMIAERTDPINIQTISERTAENTRRLVLDFILPHAMEFYRSAETVTEGDRIKQIASYVLTSGKTEVTASQLTHNVHSLKGTSLVEVHKRLSPLVAGGWLTPVRPWPNNKAWTVNKAVHVHFAERRRQEEERKRDLARLMGSPRKPVELIDEEK